MNRTSPSRYEKNDDHEKAFFQEKSFEKLLYVNSRQDKYFSRSAKYQNVTWIPKPITAKSKLIYPNRNFIQKWENMQMF